MTHIKKFRSFAAVLALSFIGMASTAEALTQDMVYKPDIICFGLLKYGTAGDTVPFCIDVLGNIIPGRNQEYTIGTPTQTFKSGFFGK